MNEIERSIAGVTYPDEAGFIQITDRLKAVTKTVKDRDLSTALGLQPSTVSTAKTRKLVPSNWLVIASTKYLASADWLMYGDSVNKMETNFRAVPISEAHLDENGAFNLVETADELAFKKDWLATKGNLNNLVLLQMKGDSMKPLMLDKDLILINTGLTKPAPEAIFAIAFNNFIYFKRLYTEPDKLIFSSADRQTYPDITVNIKDFNNGQVKILGRAIWWGHEENL